ncbi:endoplasmic reticulum aminopeptidase 1-like [Bradysia coprophila]|uniref:endoplasmic reticulum aminopeptidase 1-like n=1 Tax=Bradysia coprophila TaxID=38358 RepID=UPI00187DB97A|nr:endoplasmic reticulum aminopeptidase 1-like [Bradysia coprophila]
MNPDGSVTTHFETTPLMSTYLVAFHVSDFLNVTSTPPRSVPQRIFSRSTAINATALPLEAGELLIDALTDYIGIEYSLPKMDHVAVPRWYTYLWMKEGFATFFEYLGVDLVHPDWQMMDYFVVEVAQLMFFADATTNTRPMTYYVERPYDIDEHFNRVAYSKGAAVLRMFWFMFGEETFMRAVRSYLEDNAYSNAAKKNSLTH